MSRNIITALWDFFCSLKLTIIILILLATTSIIGTVIVQNRSPEEYLKVYSETTYRVLDALQFFDMYHSWWFLALLGFFAVNLIACSIKRFPRVWKTVKKPLLVPDETHFGTLSNFEEQVVEGSVSELREKLAAFLERNFATPVITEEEGKVHLFAQKGAYARFGVYLTHLSILIIFIGAIIGNLFGYEGFVTIVEGTEINKVWTRGNDKPIDLDFSVRCDKFSVSFYEGTGRPKEFKSLLTVLENGEPVKNPPPRRPVVVNDPLTYKGITFYQSSYGPAGNPVFNFRVKTRATGETVDVTARQSQRIQLSDGSNFRVIAYTPSDPNFGPMARLEVISESGQRRMLDVLQAFPDFDARRGGEYIFTLVDLKQPYYTGLQVTKDPGVWIVWIGCTLLVMGSLVAFLLSHRRIWFTIQPLGDKTGIKFGGTAHRNQPAFELFFERFKEKLKAELAS